ncbi:MAG: hypothetical protein IPL37_07355 [Austwickia sp.]|nr:hypothetical protein [Austwickia sp.]
MVGSWALLALARLNPAIAKDPPATTAAAAVTIRLFWGLFVGIACPFRAGGRFMGIVGIPRLVLLRRSAPSSEDSAPNL